LTEIQKKAIVEHNLSCLGSGVRSGERREPIPGGLTAGLHAADIPGTDTRTPALHILTNKIKA